MNPSSFSCDADYLEFLSVQITTEISIVVLLLGYVRSTSSDV